MKTQKDKKVISYKAKIATRPLWFFSDELKEQVVNDMKKKKIKQDEEKI